jgi:ABC-type lipoprotein release transport system permease subunit
VLAGALVAAIGLGIVAAIVPAMRASRLRVTDALRRID